MSTNHKSRPPRISSRRNHFISERRAKIRPDLSVDTSFTQNGTSLPKQVYPANVLRQQNIVSLDDIKALSQERTEDDTAVSCEAPESLLHVRAGAQRFVNGNGDVSRHAVHQNLIAAEREGPPPPYNESRIFRSADRTLPSTSNAKAPPRAERRKHARQPAPLRVNTAISPAVREIEIGLTVSSTAIRDQKYNLESAIPRSQPSLNNRSSPKSAQTPTIVITPADAEFDFGLKDMTHRPPSSVYSRYTSGQIRIGRREHTPPVPSLPAFAYQPRSTNRIRQNESLDLAIPNEALPQYSPSPQISQIASFYNDCSEGDYDCLRSPTLRGVDRMSSQTYVPTPRRSRGWWNFVTSPFSSSSNKHFFPADSPLAAGGNQRDAPRLEIPVASPLGEIFTKRPREDNELRSAPPTDSNRKSLQSRSLPKPKRSDTAPGGLDVGDVDKVNIYRTPSQGAASSYYDQSRRFPSVIAPSTKRSLNDDPAWSPSQSVFRGSFDASTEHSERNDRDLGSMEIPVGGEAASYYDPTIDYANERGRNMQRVRASGHEDTTSTSQSNGTLRSGISGEPSKVRKTSIVLDQDMHSASGGGDARGSQANSYLSFDSVDTHTPNEDFSASTRKIDDESSTQQSRADYALPIRRGNPLASAPRIADKPRSVQYTGTQQSDTDLECGDTGADYVHEKDERGLLHKADYDLNERQEQAAHRPWYRGLFLLLAACGILLIVLLIVLLALFVPVGSDGTPVQARWLNLTGYPPLPTGVLTVVGTNQNEAVNGCVSPVALWSCKVPPGHGLSTTQPGQPNFRFEITFRNGTVPSNATQLQPLFNANATRYSSSKDLGGMLTKRSAENDLYKSIPPPPSREDQAFLGRTSDDISRPYEGEETPFFIGLLNPVSLRAAREPELEKRTFKYPYPSSSARSPEKPTPSSSDSTGSSATPFPTGSRDIPSASLQANGEPDPPNLHPLVYAQPVRLFNRGQESEHYGFYTYYDRSLYLAGLSSGNSGRNSSGTAVADVPLVGAAAVCTWSQTRLLMKIFTRKPSVTDLRPGRHGADTPAINSTANDMTSPGSFPYAVTVTIDRHGGDPAKKGVYCYGLDDQHHIMKDVHTWVDEDRSFQGNIVHPGPIPTNNGVKMDKLDDDKDTGIDGGTGGCSCRWNN